MNHLLKIDIPVEWEGLMIKEILLEHYNFSRKSLTNLKNNKGIYLNDIPTFVTMRVNKGDTLNVYVIKETSIDIIPQPIPLDIFYEDKDIIVINKPANIVVHPTRNHYLNTIANGLIYYWQEKGVQYRFRPVHRLDRDTSGLFVIAKNQYSHHKLALQLNDKNLKRIYHGIVHGRVKDDHGVIEAPILKDPNHGMKRIVEVDNLEAKLAKTYYKTIKSNDCYSLIELELATGRTHQIRVHMAWIGHPLIGDDLYGGNTKIFKRQALHAMKLEFFHPITGKPLSFEATYPDDMKNFLDTYLN
ncbi:MAG: RluA family pseudouridine synthase [Vulcanibacillus sp.]